MNGYLTAEQVAQLLKPINGKRVGQDGKGFSHVEAYDIRAHLNRIFGFGRWSDEVTRLNVVFESVKEGYRKKNKQGEEYGDAYDAWTVCYSATVRVTVNAPDGTVLAVYEDGATGDSSNQPSRSDAHDMALKTALSQAFKRAAVNLGDQFGLSLYNKGSKNALVGRVLVTPEDNGADQGDAKGAPVKPADVDAHITEPLASEGAEVEPAPELRERNGSTPPAAEPSDAFMAAEAIRDTLLAVVASGGPDRVKTIGNLMKQAQRDRCLAVEVEHNGKHVALKVLLEQALQVSHAA